jgi:hypothetical protein
MTPAILLHYRSDEKLLMQSYELEAGGKQNIYGRTSISLLDVKEKIQDLKIRDSREGDSARAIHRPANQSGSGDSLAGVNLHFCETGRCSIDQATESETE